MFTGLVETIGTVSKVQRSSTGRELTMHAVFDGESLRVGDSVSCDGACLTVVSLGRESFVVQVSEESIARTTLSRYTAGSRLNLERALRVGDRLDGHLVSGHIDCVGTVSEYHPVGESILLEVQYDSSYDRFVVEKGSIAINGVSLTVNSVVTGGLRVNLIPHTMSKTTLGGLTRGDHVNLEFDIIGKYVARQAGSKGESLSMQKLIESGW